jgi:hypothetical protein
LMSINSYTRCVYCSFLDFVICPVVNQVMDHSHVSVSSWRDGAGSGSSNGGRKDCLRLNTCFGGKRRCIRIDGFEEVQAVLNCFEVVKNLTERVVVNTGLVFKAGQSSLNSTKSIVCNNLLMDDFSSKSVGVSIPLVGFEAV